MSQVAAVTCPYCNTRIEPEALPSEPDVFRGTERLKGTELECSSCGDDFELYFY